MYILNYSQIPEIPFIYNGRDTEVSWKDDGISLFFQASYCENPIKFSIDVYDDEYILPPEHKDMSLVSAMYKITASHSLPEPVKVRMEHCAVIRKEDELEFMVAHEGPQGPPYTFNPLPGGDFPSRKFYGEIKLHKFCIFGIFRRCWRPSFTKLVVHIAYCRDGSADFVVTKHLKQHIAAVKEEYRETTTLVPFSKKCPTSTTEIKLVVPKTINDGWMIKSVCEPPLIDMKDVTDYELGKCIPSIKLNMTWKGEGHPRKGNVKVKVQGIENFKCFNLTCNPPLELSQQPAMSRTSLQPSPLPFLEHKPDLEQLLRLKVYERITVKNHDFGITLLKDAHGSITSTIEYQHKGFPTRITEAILQRWLEGTGRTPQTWHTLLTVLREIELNTLANDIEESLSQAPYPAVYHLYIFFFSLGIPITCYK